MYLKSLKLTGFKSFADRTRLEFRPGVTVVVGPNGSGKSNLVDALSWVLGSQSPKSLRSPKMEDVIFAGTTSRPALGRAEVSLVIDNTDRLIDLDLDEVAITRRLYRDGSSDYELNGVGCRLLDIQDLLSDSGVGRHQHVIIGQGEIGQVLNSSPEEHRAVIEEAAGILKHRRRKERAERRLERTDEDLVRLNDIIGEIERQMRPLRRQARAAQRYDGVKSEVVALRLYLGGRALEIHDRDLAAATAERDRLLEGLSEDTARIDELGKELSVLTEEASRVAGELERDTSAAALLETGIERLRRVASVAHERRRATSGRLEAATERRADLEREAVEIDAELTELAGKRETLAVEVETAETLMLRLEGEERELAGQASMSPEGAQAAVRGELSGVEAALVRDSREIDSVAHRLEVLRSRVEEERGSISSIDVEMRDLDVGLAALQETYQKAETARGAEQKRWEDAEASLNSSRIEVASMTARVEAIASALEGRFDAESRALVESAPGAVGSLVSRLDVPEGLEVAVGAALDGWVDAVSFDGPDPLRDVMASVKAAGGGSVSIVAPRPGTGAPAREVAAATGLEALIDLLGPGTAVDLAEAVLGDVVLAQGWLAGWEVVRAHPSVRVVTSDGDLLTSDGVRLANPDGAAPVMLDHAEVALEKALTAHARAVSIHTAARRDFDASREAERSALEALEEAEARLAGHSEAMARISQSVSGLDAEIERLESRHTALVATVEDAEARAVTLRERIESLQGEEDDLHRAMSELEARRAVMAADREMARSGWQEKSGALRSLVERERMLSDRRQKIADQLGRVDAGPRPDADPASLELLERAAQEGLAVIESGLAVLRERQAELRTVNASARAKLSGAREEHERLRDRVVAARESVSGLEVRMTEARLGRESVIEAIRRDADAGPEAAYAAGRPDLPEGDSQEGADLEVTLASRMAELARMGPINPLAAVEFRDLEERHDFLRAQVSDVEGSRAELRKVITALDNEIDERFRAAFEEVSTAFEKYFALLFPGGRGRMRLLEPGESNSGVSIDAQPVGKKLSQMSLLSGGERSLAALAFLFAIFEARPSPFYVLDEVEAALDDVNLRRFLRIVDEFRGRAQLVIITHQQQTMEAADVLYGITMEAGGASQAIRKDMATAREELAAASAIQTA